MKIFRVLILLVLLSIQKCIDDIPIPKHNEFGNPVGLVYDCNFYNLSKVIDYYLCKAEKKELSFRSPEIGCLLFEKNRYTEMRSSPCKNIKYAPGETNITKSKLPPDAKNKEYQRLAEAAEKLVPKTWFIEGFADDNLLLTHNYSELPLRLLDISTYRNKRLRNIVQCSTRLQFIRKSYDFSLNNPNYKSLCENNQTISIFSELWIEEQDVLGGYWTSDDFSKWVPRESTKSLAWEIIDLFTRKFGGIWTGCFDIIDDISCRGALAAAALVASVSELDAFAVENDNNPSNLILGYMLATLGRNLLHGDTSAVGNKPITNWNVKLNDFIAVQAIYLKLYIKSYGFAYSKQLDYHIPLKFVPSFTVYHKRSKKSGYFDIEPVYSSLRNLMFTESLNLIDFGPYRPMVALHKVKADILYKKKRRVLIDVGANGFFASPKYLLDSYSIYLPFTDAIMIEPEPHFSASIPEAYLKSYNISFLQLYAEVGTGNTNDMLKLLPTLVSKDDFVVLKFDVDPNKYAQGYTMEWGFLFSLMGTKEIAELIDELYIELHFYMPMLFWDHYHSNWEALDAIRYLRKKGVFVHAWP